jgi:preprotein translocase subunit SecG
MITLLGILFFLVCILLVFMVVITPSNEGGMAAAFGGMGSDSFFGTKAHKSINKFTVGLAVLFMVLAIFINKLNARQTQAAPGDKGEIQKKVESLPPDPKAPPGGLPPGLPPIPQK